jgi:uncharacterized protein DUF4129
VNGSDRVRRHPALTATAVAALLVLVALGTHGRSWAGGSSGTRHLPPAFWDYVFSGAAVIWLALGLYAFHIYLSMRREAGVRFDPRRAAASFLLFVAVLLAISLLASHLRHVARFQGRPGHHVQIVGAGPSKAGTRAATPRSSHFRWQSAAGVAVVLLAVGAGMLVVQRRRRPQRLRQRDAAVALAALLDDTLDDLRREPDPRKAVIAAYARMERTLAAYGLPRAPAEAPEEYLRRVLAELQVGGPAARRLTDLFARAKFSPHEVDAAMKEEAIGALVEVRGELQPEPAA